MVYDLVYRVIKQDALCYTVCLLSEASGKLAIVEPDPQNPAAVMVWAGICDSAVEQGVKTKKDVYSRDILEAVVLPWTQQHVGDADWIFQQDFAPAPKTKLTQY